MSRATAPGPPQAKGRRAAGNATMERATAAEDNAAAVFARLAERDEDSDLAALIRCGAGTARLTWQTCGTRSASCCCLLAWGI